MAAVEEVQKRFFLLNKNIPVFDYNTPSADAGDILTIVERSVINSTVIQNSNVATRYMYQGLAEIFTYIAGEKYRNDPDKKYTKMLMECKIIQNEKDELKKIWGDFKIELDDNGIKYMNIFQLACESYEDKSINSNGSIEFFSMAEDDIIIDMVIALEIGVEAIVITDNTKQEKMIIYKVETESEDKNQVFLDNENIGMIGHYQIHSDEGELSDDLIYGKVLVNSALIKDIISDKDAMYLAFKKEISIMASKYDFTQMLPEIEEKLNYTFTKQQKLSRQGIEKKFGIDFISDASLKILLMTLLIYRNSKDYELYYIAIHSTDFIHIPGKD